MAVPVCPTSSWPPGLSTSICTGSALVVGSITPASCTWSGSSGIGSGRPGISSATLGDVAGGRDVGGRHLRAAARRVGPDDPEERRAFVVRGAERRHHLGDAAGDRRAQRRTRCRPRRRRRCAASRRAARAALRAACSRASATATARRASSTRRAGTARSASSRSARVCSARARLERGLRLGDVGGERRAIVAGRQPRLEAAERLARRAPSSPIDEQRVGREPAGGRRGDDRLAAGQRLDRRRHADRRSHLGFAHRRGRELVGPLLLLQVGDRRGIVGRLLLGVGDGRLPRRRTP